MEHSDLKTVIMIGRTEAGKTTLANKLIHDSDDALKTQAIGRIGNIIDTPGEFIENPVYYRAVLLHSYDADIVIFVNEADDKESIFPPNFASAFNREVIGVITKADVGGSTETARHNLETAGVTKIFTVSVKEQATIDALRAYIAK